MRTCLLGLLAVGAVSAADAPAGKPEGTDDLYDAGKQLFDQYAPAQIKEQFEFPSRKQFDEFLAQVQHASESGSLEELATYEPQARSVLSALRAVPGYGDYADWLASRLGEIEEAALITKERPPLPKTPVPGGTIPAGGEGRPAPRPVPSPSPIPYYERWYERERGRPVPAGAGQLMPGLRAAFSAEGVPPELAWIAEVESSLKPSARSPSGARGLFQLMPETAQKLGLSTFLPDERTDPEKSARAAARQLRALGKRFGSWPLALAAYNAGEGRVGRLVADKRASNFAAIADSLPGGTRMYVPEVCALVAVRTGVSPEQLPAPR